MIFQCFLNYYTCWVSIRSLLWSKLIVIRNVLQMSSKARVNTSISKQVFFRPCLNELRKSLYIYSTYVISIRSLTNYWIVLYIPYFFGRKHAFIKKEKSLKHENEEYVTNILNHSKVMLGCRFGCSPLSNTQNPSSFPLKSKQQRSW
jgi:hypothetical protein